MADIETDYLIIGGGAVGLAFADTLLQETDADIVIVDRRGKPGGHWNDAYSFVALHQPSAFYGVNSMPLGSGRIDTHGPNQGFHELASGPEVSGYFDRVLHQRLLASGRLRWLPMTECEEASAAASAAPGEPGPPVLRSLLSDERSRVTVRRKRVDASYFGTQVPATHTPRFSVAEGVKLVPPNALPQLWQGRLGQPREFVIVGAGKTAMDVGVWLLASGAPPQSIQWIVPRESWLLNRRSTQPGLDFFEHSMGGQLLLMESLIGCQSVEELFLRLEAGGLMMRLHADTWPTMFHFATLSEGEAEQLRRITRVVRAGRVTAIHPERMQLERGELPVGPDTLFIDCSASAVERRPPVPVFQGGRIVLQMVRIPQPTFSAALLAWVEAHESDEARKNSLCAPIPLPDAIEGYPRAVLTGMLNQFHWSRHPELRRWIRASRLDGFGKLVAEIDPADAARQALLQRMKTAAQGLMMAAPRWMAMS